MACLTVGRFAFSKINIAVDAVIEKLENKKFF
jgi:hypothetical protein